MIIRCIAPLRIGFAGGGSDVSPYSDLFGGAVLNATIDRYARVAIEPADNGEITFVLADQDIEASFDALPELSPGGPFALAAGVYNRVVKDFARKALSFRLTTSVDAPPGSGLGSSSTLVVALLGAFAEWLRIPSGEYDTAHLAYEIERIDLGLAGGKQDQYAATFGGFNFMEFGMDGRVIVNPLQIKQEVLNELANNLLLYNTSTSRLSATIIEAQQLNVRQGNQQSIEAMHAMKNHAFLMKKALLAGEIDEIGELLNYGWRYKKQMADGITNALLDKIYETALAAGATGGKISGAGGGGFMLFYCPGNTNFKVTEALKQFGGDVLRYSFTKEGMRSWCI